jgi:dTDP-4-amino-4,6-dideoxygalactose transaminase
MTATSLLAAHGGTKALDIPHPHYTWPSVTAGLEDAVRAQLHRSLSDRDASGVIGEFETAFARFVGAPHAVSFASGTSAIHAMSRIAGLRPGDAIIAPAYTFFATATPFAYDGIEVRFADAGRYGNVTAATLAEKLTPAVRAVIVTHMWGNPCPMDEIVEFCRTHELLLLEDCSHAHFASWRGERVGTFGDMAVFSTNQKAITTGEGGILVTANDRNRELALLFGHYNKRCQKEINPAAEYYPYSFTGMGLKHRITTLGAAIGLHQLDHAADIEARRRAILARYTTGLADNPVITPAVVPGVDGQHGLYVLGLRFHPENASVSRDEFVALCGAEGATEVDAPGSTRDISTEPLFARRDPFATWVPSTPPATELPGVVAFQDTFIKIPLWGYPGDEPLVAGYLDVLTKVSAAVELRPPELLLSAACTQRTPTQLAIPSKWTPTATSLSPISSPYQAADLPRGSEPTTRPRPPCGGSTPPTPKDWPPPCGPATLPSAMRRPRTTPPCCTRSKPAGRSARRSASTLPR